MRKLFLLIVGMVLTLSAQATTKLWDFAGDTWKSLSVETNTTIDGLTIAATSDKKVTTDASGRLTILNDKGRLRLNGAGSADARNVSFNVSGRSLITVVVTHPSSSGDPRTIGLAKGSFDNLVKQMTIPADATFYLTYYNTEGSDTYYLYGIDNGLNIEAIYVKELTSTLVDVYDFAAEANAGNNPTKLNTGNKFWVWMKNESGNYCKQPNNWRGYEWTSGSLLPQCDFVFTYSTQINGKLVKDNPVSGWKADNETRPIIIAGVAEGMNVIVDYDASSISDAAKQQLIWASATGDGSDAYASAATIDGTAAEAVHT